MERNGQIVFRHRGYTARHWAPSDRKQAGDVIRQCLESYGLQFEPQGADRDALEVEEFYQKKNKGEFWVVMEDSTGKLVGTGGYYEVGNGHEGEKEELGNCKGRVEIRKMYLAPAARGKQLGRTLLQKLEEVVALKGYQEVIVETASVLVEACQLYKTAGYQPMGGVETERCDCRLHKMLLH